MKNKQIVISCDYEVYDSEWEELASRIAELLKKFSYAKYSNMRVRIKKLGEE